MAQVRLILDTDIGTDVDDVLALAVVFGSPELRLEAVSCVYGDVDLRASVVSKLLRLGGRGSASRFDLRVSSRRDRIGPGLEADLA
jgi:inosine-uridine nucleoside N-ribohydrolase